MEQKQKAASIAEYLAGLEPERREVLERLMAVVREHLPPGFQEELNYGMPGWVVPHSRYPAGYHCKPRDPLPFLGVAAQKSHFALYHMGLYSDPELLAWFQEEFARQSPRKLDMGKSCIRFKKAQDIPFGLLGQLVEKMSVERWIELYESQVKPS